MSRYSQGICEGGAAILCDEEKMTVDEVVDRLNAGARSIVLATKHCQRSHHDWPEVCAIYDGEFAIKTRREK